MAHTKTTSKTVASDAGKPLGRTDTPKGMKSGAGSAKPQKQGTKAKAKK